MKRLLFPDPPRDFPARRATRVTLRALHVLAAGVLAGAVIVEAPSDQIARFALWAAVSGSALLLTDLHASFAVVFEVRGIVVALKIVALWLSTWSPQAAPYLLCAALLAGVVSSHMPARYRHRLWALRERVVPDERKG